jgi:hypothetical protein
VTWRTLNPSVPRSWLIAIAGVLWCAVGVMLWLHAVAWLRDLHGEMALPLGLGLGLGVVAHLTLFARIARKNLVRLRAYPPRACLFAFQAWRGYVMIALMIGLGVLLRHLPVPPHYLAVGYAAIGTALILSGVLVGANAFSPRR